MKTKTCVTLLLILSLIWQPCQTRCQNTGPTPAAGIEEPPPKQEGSILLPVLVVAATLIAYGLMAIGVKKALKKIDQPPAPPPPECRPPIMFFPVLPCPPVLPPVIFPPPGYFTIDISVGPDAMQTRTITSLGFLDPSGQPYNTVSWFRIESSTSLDNWVTDLELAFTNYCSTNWAFITVSRNGQCVLTNQIDLSAIPENGTAVSYFQLEPLFDPTVPQRYFRVMP